MWADPYRAIHIRPKQGAEGKAYPLIFSFLLGFQRTYVSPLDRKGFI
jgi:hypothetical protein